MRLMGLFAVLILALPLAAFSKEKFCGKSIAVHKDKNLQKIRTAVEAALLAGNLPKLLKLASCDFLMGTPDSDSGGYRRAKNILPKLAPLLKGVKFKSKADDFGTQVNVASENSKQNYTLIYRNDDEAGWYWSGLTMDESPLLDSFVKGSY